MRRRIGLCLAEVAIGALLIIGWAVLITSIGLSRDTTAILALVGGLLVGSVIGPVLALTWIES